MKKQTTALLEIIQRWVSASKFSRDRIDPDEVVNEAYCRLSETEKLPEDAGELSFAVEQVVRHTIRDLKRSMTVAVDVDELPHEEHPFYESETDSPEAEFEEVFLRFCESQPEPKRTIYQRCRTHSRKDIVRIANVRLESINRMMDEMPAEFKKFIAGQDENNFFVT